MSTSRKTAHHHGDLKAALVNAGIKMLEAGEAFSLRAVAREVGVSQAAPYRHFPDKEHLEAAMATQGFTVLHIQLEEEIARLDSTVQLVDLALVYLRYATENPALYELMYSRACGEGDQRLAAADEVFALIERTVATFNPHVSAYDLATAGWALCHGLASLYLDGKLKVAQEGGLEARVRKAFSAITV